MFSGGGGYISGALVENGLKTKNVMWDLFKDSTNGFRITVDVTLVPLFSPLSTFVILFYHLIVNFKHVSAWSFSLL